MSQCQISRSQPLDPQHHQYHQHHQHPQHYQQVNKFPHAHFTTKIGIHQSLQQLHWFTNFSMNSFFPRCYQVLKCLLVVIGWRLWWPSDWRGGGARERRGHQRLAKFLEKTLILSKNVFTNHLFCDWLYVDFTSEWYTSSCQRVNCKPHFLWKWEFSEMSL